jgi:hypothetical protein
MLERCLQIGPKHPLFPQYVGAAFSSYRERRGVIRTQTGELVSYYVFALLDAAEATIGNRSLENYIQHMTDPTSIVNAFFYHDNGRLPTKEEFEELKSAAPQLFQNKIIADEVPVKTDVDHPGV